MTYPAKPWTNGMIATEIVPGQTYIYNALNSTWVHQTKATLDSDYQVDKATTDATLTSHTSTLSAHATQISQIQGILVTHKQAHNADSDALVALTARVDTLDLLSDSEAGRVQSAIDTINTALTMLDSDGVALQSIKTQADSNSSNIAAIMGVVDNYISPKLAADSDRMSAIEASIVANNALDAVSKNEHDSDVGVINATITTLPIPVVSASQPTGKTGQLWINTNDNKLYFWNGVDAFVTIATV